MKLLLNFILVFFMINFIAFNEANELLLILYVGTAIMSYWLGKIGGKNA